MDTWASSDPRHETTHCNLTASLISVARLHRQTTRWYARRITAGMHISMVIWHDSMAGPVPTLHPLNLEPAAPDADEAQRQRVLGAHQPEPDGRQLLGAAYIVWQRGRPGVQLQHSIS